MVHARARTRFGLGAERRIKLSLYLKRKRVDGRANFGSLLMSEKRSLYFLIVGFWQFGLINCLCIVETISLI